MVLVTLYEGMPPNNCKLKTLDSVQTWKLLKKFHQNFVTGIYFRNHNPNIKVFVKLFSKSLQGVGRSPTVFVGAGCGTESHGFMLAAQGVGQRPTVLCWRHRVWDGVSRFYVGERCRLWRCSWSMYCYDIIRAIYRRKLGTVNGGNPWVHA